MTRKLSSVSRFICSTIFALLCIGIFCLVKANATHVVTFYDYDGTVIVTQTVKHNQPAELPENPYREGHTFISWEGEYLTIQADTDLTATYEINQYQIDFIDHDGTVISSQTVNHGDIPTLPEQPVREGYTFIGYDMKPTAATSDIVYTAQYQINQYTIQFLNFDGTVLQETVYDYNTSVTPPSDPVKPSDGKYVYTFSGWDKTVTAATADTVYTAQFNAKRITCDYCGSEDHKVATCAAKSIAKGALGRWSIPSVGVNVACYKSWDQSVCDAKDSACYFTLGDMDVIGDHWNQGFNAIKSCVPGTKAYLETASGTQTYVCTKIFTGHNTGSLTDDDYNDLSRGYNTGGITCYTCNDHWSNVTIVFFQPA